MLDGNKKNLMIRAFFVGSIFLALIATNLVYANGGSIAMANSYPEDGGKYSAVDHFTYQITAVNTNVTVSVSIDGEPLIPMTFQGVRNEAVNGDTVARDWYTWQVTIPAITNQSRHTFQFLSHYYVWQETDHYWAELNARSTPQIFTITNPFSTPQAPDSSITPIVPQLQPVPEFPIWIALPLAIIMTVIGLRHSNKKGS